MTITITWNVVQIIVILIQGSIIGFTIFNIWRFNRLSDERKRLMDEREAMIDGGFELLKKMQPEELAKKVHANMLGIFVRQVDMLERALADIHFLHDEVYKARFHPDDCPVCSATTAQLSELIETLRTVKFDVQAGE